MPAITVLGPRDEVQRRWDGPPATFRDAPKDRGTEIHVATDDHAEAYDALRRFKQLFETGVLAQSDATPEGESAGSKAKQRPAQPLEEVPA